MPEDMKDMLRKIVGAPIFIGRPRVSQVSPFYEVKNGKVEEIVFVEAEDDDWDLWGFEDDDLSFI